MDTAEKYLADFAEMPTEIQLRALAAEIISLRVLVMNPSNKEPERRSAAALLLTRAKAVKNWQIRREGSGA